MRCTKKERHKQGVAQFFLDLSIYLCLHNLAAFQNSSFQQGLIPSNLWKGQSFWGHKRTQNWQKWGHFLTFHAPSSYSHSCTGWVARAMGGTSSWVSCGSITFSTFHFCSWIPAMPLIPICWDCPLLGQGKLGSLHSAAGTKEPETSLLPAHHWPSTPLPSWWSLSEKWFLMAPEISKAGLPFIVGKAH